MYENIIREGMQLFTANGTGGLATKFFTVGGEMLNGNYNLRQLEFSYQRSRYQTMFCAQLRLQLATLPGCAPPSKPKLLIAAN